MRIVNLPTTRATILVILESPALCELLEIILARSGYHVVSARDQESALAMAREIPSIELVLRGIDPEINGRDFDADFADYHPAAHVALLANCTDELPSDLSVNVLEMPFSASDLRAFVCRSLSDAMGKRAVAA